MFLIYLKKFTKKNNGCEVSISTGLRFQQVHQICLRRHENAAVKWVSFIQCGRHLFANVQR